MKVLVTGGSGFIGSRVVRRLIERRYRVRCLLRPSSETRRIADLAWEEVRGDVHDPRAFVEAAEGCEACIHLASPSAWSAMRSTDLDAAVGDGARNAVRAASAAGLSASSSSRPPRRSTDPGRPVSSTRTVRSSVADSGLRYALAKHRAEQIVLAAADSEVVIVNPVEVFGPEDDRLVTAGTLRDVLRSWPALGCQGGAGIASVDDVAEGIVRALERGRAGRRYILGGENLTVEQVVRLTLALGGQRGKPVVILPRRPVTALIHLLARLGLPTPLGPDLVGYATRYWFMNDAKARRELGYTSRPAREALGQTIAWLQAAGLVSRRRGHSARPG